MTSYPAKNVRRSIDVQSYLPLVERIARSFLRRVPSHVTAEELVSAGVVGLLEAADRYEASRGIPFDRFASSRVRGAILDDLRRRDLMARDARSESKKLEQAIDSLTASLGRAPEEAELAEELGIPVETLRERLEKL
ncbi:MAG: sigma-70 family RNA polymerase sigma factor, partial [Myxococcota bacterium]